MIARVLGNILEKLYSTKGRQILLETRRFCHCIDRLLTDRTLASDSDVVNRSVVFTRTCFV